MKSILALPAAIILVALTVKGADDKLSFHSGADGGLVFDTGIVKGGLQKDGLGEGIKPIQFTDGGDSFVINHGLLCPYRFLTPDKRFGFGSWEWPRMGRILQDGSVELSWKSAADRPFHFSQKFRWISSNTLDMTVQFTAEAELKNFELFLGSYFTNGLFPKTRVFLHDAGNGAPGFVEATRARGVTQLYPAFQTAEIVKDGRWKLPPYPMDWRIGSPLQAPLGLKQNPATGQTVIFMSPTNDCFAVSTWEQQARQGGFYLSLFGRTVGQGETLIGHVRVVFANNISDDEVLRLYATYHKDLGYPLDPAVTHLAISASTASLDWISPEVPHPNAEGWITLFDGKHLYGCSPSATDLSSGKIALQSDGTLRLNATSLPFALEARDGVIRAALKKISGPNCGLSLRRRTQGEWRDCVGWFNGGNWFGIGQTKDQKWNGYLNTHIQKNHNDFFTMEFQASGPSLTLKANGEKVGEATDRGIIKGNPAVGSKGTVLFKRIEFKVMD